MGKVGIHIVKSTERLPPYECYIPGVFLWEFVTFENIIKNENTLQL